MALICAKLRCTLSKLNTIKSQCLRPFSYKSSPFLEDLGNVSTKYEVTNNAEEWKYVERLMPLTVVPEPLKKDSYPSGWKPQADNLQDQPYFIERTKNHMIPVYLAIAERGIRRYTIIKKVQGDIWLLEKELREFLQPQSLRPLRIQVNEFGGYIRMNGDYVNAIKYWLEQKNF